MNVDFPQRQHNVLQVVPDLEADIETLDFPEGSVAEIRLHHVFEHFSRVVALGSLIRWHEWLEWGGRLVIETPDFVATASSAVAASDGDRMALIRHLEGDQADVWAYHLGQWYPERFQRTLTALGFDQIEIETTQTPWHLVPLHNVTARCVKVRDRRRSMQLAAADALLRESMAAASETTTWSVWRRQLRDWLSNTRDAPSKRFASVDARPAVDS